MFSTKRNYLLSFSNKRALSVCGFPERGCAPFPQPLRAALTDRAYGQMANVTDIYCTDDTLQREYFLVHLPPVYLLLTYIMLRIKCQQKFQLNIQVTVPVCSRYYFFKVK